MKNGHPDTHDLKLLRKLASEGPQFLRHVSHELRACDLRAKGFVTGEAAVYAMKGGGASVEYRTRYAITDQGRALLSNSEEPR